MPTISMGNATFPAAVRLERRLKCWNTIPMFRRTSRSRLPRNPVTSTPSMKIWPFSGRSSRLMQRIRVLFPAPLGPMMPKISPG